MEPGYQSGGISQMNLLLGGGFFLVILFIAAFLYHRSFRKSSNPENIKDIIAQRKATVESNAASLGQKRVGIEASSGKKEGFANATGKGKEVSLLRLQPFAVKQSGYIGPAKDGVFDEKDSVIQALKAGVRTFILQIDFHEDPAKGAPLFPLPGEPCLLVRDATGNLVSLNSGSIQKVTEAIAQYGFSDTIQGKYDPILLILYGLRAPDRITKPKDYILYCSKIAKQLGPLAPFHLGLTPMGDYHRQALAGQIFIEPFTHFEKKVIILSNFDTTLFRNITSLELPAISPAEDLDYWVNAQIFKEDTKASFGVTGVAPMKTPIRSGIYDIELLKGLTGEQRTAWLTQHRGIFTMVLPGPEENPDYDTIGKLLNELGVNVVPLDIYSFDTASTKRSASAWNNATWKEKPVSLI